MKKTILILSLSMFICGCASYQVRRYSQIQNKTVLVSSESHVLKTAILDEMRADGWEVFVSDADNINAIDARYTMRTSIYGVNGMDMWHFNTILIDRATNKEAFSMECKATKQDAAQRVVEELRKMN